ncbi:MAG: FeS-binding protein [Dehalococcoidia bacterium]|nr:FeS-binding protein [Dehalococcoidia bacterium]
MAKRRVMFTFPQDLITQPVIYNLGIRFRVITNIRRADVTEDRGWVSLELDGNEEDIDRGIAWVKEIGVRVDPIEGDIVTG